jgi:hypothetical protein
MEKASDPRHVGPIRYTTMCSFLCAYRHTYSFVVFGGFIGWVRRYMHVIDRSYRFGFYLFKKSHLPGLPIISILTYA